MRRCEQHSTQTGVNRKSRDLRTETGDSALVVHSFELLEQPNTIVDEPRVGRIQERKVFRLAQPECRHAKYHAGKVGSEHLGAREILLPVEFILGIQPNANALRLTSATSLALVGARLRDPLNRQPLHLATNAVTTDACKARVNDESNSGNCEGCFGDVRRENHAASGMRREYALLIARG